MWLIVNYYGVGWCSIFLTCSLKAVQGSTKRDVNATCRISNEIRSTVAKCRIKLGYNKLVIVVQKDINKLIINHFMSTCVFLMSCARFLFVYSSLITFLFDNSWWNNGTGHKRSFNDEYVHEREEQKISLHFVCLLSILN